MLPADATIAVMYHVLFAWLFMAYIDKIHMHLVDKKTTVCKMGYIMTADRYS